MVIDVGEKMNQQAPRHPLWVSKVITTIIIIIKTVVNLMDEAWATIKPLDMVIDVGEKTNQQAPRHPCWVSKVIMTIIIIIETVVNLSWRCRQHVATCQCQDWSHRKGIPSN
jgi:hypothetical protein